ncbi:MAG: hypothetical protein HY319_28755 [Armatimonadetes bacterium]|nr:hypothetical protein [Armatimonadota bacterium]
MAEGGFLDNIMSAWGGDDVDEEDHYPDETRSPNVNILLRTARKYLDGKVSAQDYESEVRGTLERLEAALQQHRAFYESPELSDEIRGVADQADDAYEDFKGGLARMLESLARDDPEPVQEGIEICKRAASGLEAANDRFVEIQKRSELIECLMCGHANASNSRECVKCGAVLPKAMQRAAADVEETSSDMVMVPEEYMHLYEACDRVAANEIPIEQWQVHIDRFYQGFSQTGTFVRDQMTIHNAYVSKIPGLLDEAGALIDALGEAESALNEMQLFSADRDAEHLNQGWMDLLKATQKIQHTGMQFYQSLEAVAESEGAQA